MTEVENLPDTISLIPVSCCDLMTFIDAPEQPVVIVDTRPHSDYVVGHIQSSFNVRLSSLLIRRLLQNKIKLVDAMFDEQKGAFRAAMEAKNLIAVVYDSSTSVPLSSISSVTSSLSDGSNADSGWVDTAATGESPTCLVTFDRKNPLHIVAKAFLDEVGKCYFLQGGFEAFQAKYDVECDVGSKPSVGGLPNLSFGPAIPSHQSSSSSSLGALGPPSTPIERHHRDLAPCQILPFLYIGAEAHAENREILRRLGITSILNVTTKTPMNFEGITYKSIPILDSWNQNLIQHFETAFDFIDQAKNSNGVVLIHCVAGISRSPSITIAYIMKELGWSLSRAYAFVKEKRPSISPNLDFIGELQIYEKYIRKNSSSGGDASGSPPSSDFDGNGDGALSSDFPSLLGMPPSTPHPDAGADNTGRGAFGWDSHQKSESKSSVANTHSSAAPAKPRAHPLTLCIDPSISTAAFPPASPSTSSSSFSHMTAHAASSSSVPKGSAVQSASASVGLASPSPSRVDKETPVFAM